MTSYIVTFVDLLFNVLRFAIFGRVLISWVDPMGNMRVTQILREITEPIIAPIRSVMPNLGMIDLSPLVALLLIQLLYGLIRGAL